MEGWEEGETTEGAEEPASLSLWTPGDPDSSLRAWTNSSCPKAPWSSQPHNRNEDPRLPVLSFKDVGILDPLRDPHLLVEELVSLQCVEPTPSSPRA